MDKRDIGGDSFWSVDDLTPPMGKKKRMTEKAIVYDAKEMPVDKKVQNTEKPSFSYTTAVHPKRGGLLASFEKKGMLVEQVRISSWPTPYSFFEQFRINGIQFFNTCFGEAEFEPFFSFMPQYFQLNGKQLRYYLYWRDHFRKGILLRPDYSYVLLYIYEVLNLPDLLPPIEGARQLALLWACCRKDYPRLDRYLSEWLADYCLIHQVSLPTKHLMPFYGEILHKTSLKEFYIDALDTENEGGKKAYYRAILEMSSTYQFRQSKAITPQNRLLFEKHIPGAVTKLLGVLLSEEDVMPESEPKRISRDSYAGAVCSYSQKRMIDLVVHPLTLRGDLSALVTDAVRYSENCLRRGLKLRAGFQTARLTPAMKAVLDEYFAWHFPSASVEKRVEERNYDEKYDGKRGFSDDEALAIEHASRKVAQRLGAVYEEEAEGAQVPQQTAAEAVKSESALPSDTLPREELKAVLTGGYQALCDLAARRGVLPETLVEKINAYTTDLYGDILLEPSANGYSVIEDYIEELPKI
ncbi:MAG: hypothetical protein E7616_02635 [Ruminococcaceae bacterium]|nr:hypothetical protein [Oscillospiraceae bacterium]